jgi:hypothetical protein
MQTINSSGLYLYAIIPNQVDLVFDVETADDDSGVYTISHAGLSVVVSPCPQIDFHSMKRGEAARYLVAHQRVVEKVMQDFQLLPVRFGTVLADEKQVHHLLEQSECVFRTVLEKSKGQIQFEIAVLWDLPTVFQAIAQTEPVLQLKAQIGDHPPEETLSQRVALGQLVQGMLENCRQSLQKIILPVLREIAQDMVINPLMDDGMILNAAVLVDEAGRLALEKSLEALDAAFERNQSQLPGGTQLIFRCVGPLPLYSFATVDVHALQFATVDAARRSLGLAETAAPDDIKSAYRQKAGQAHPDHNPNLPGAEQRMAELTGAYQLLTAYSNSAPHPCAFDRAAVEHTLLVAVQRQSDFVPSNPAQAA